MKHKILLRNMYTYSLDCLICISVEAEVTERKQFITEMAKVGLSRKMKEEVEGEIADKLREMKLMQNNRLKQIESLERLKSKC